jgi:hypothetical protein
MSGSPHYKDAARARNALWATFGLMGIVSMAWVPGIPEIKDLIGFSDGQFGILLMGSTVGALLSAELDNHAVDMEETKAKIPLFGRAVLPLWALGLGLFGIRKKPN